MFPLRTRFSETPNSELQTPKISEKRVLSRRNVFWVGETCSHSEHVFPKLRTPNSENFGETCSESEKRVPTLNPFFRNSEHQNSENFGETCPESEKRVLGRRNEFPSEHVFPKLRTPKISEKRVLSRENVFWVGETCSHSEHVFPKLRAPNSENFGETCSESEKRVRTQNPFFRNSELRTPKISEKRVLSQRNVF